VFGGDGGDINRLVSFIKQRGQTPSLFCGVSHKLFSTLWMSLKFFQPP
jgi:hypothetical protein